MSSFLCFLCHNTVINDTNAETREKYKDLVGMKLCPDSHLCHICCHLLKKLWLFKSICLRRSMEYPILFSDKGTVTLQNTNIENIILCPEADECDQQPHKTYHFTSDNDNIDTNQYVSLEDKTDMQTDMQTDMTENIEDDEKNDDNNDNCNDDDEVFNNSETEDIQTQEEEKDTENSDDVNDKPKPMEDNKQIEFYKMTLSVEEQKAELEQKRREDKYLEAEFKCYNCAMGFLFKDTYQAHMMRHEESNGEHLCPVCLLRFATAAVLRAHLLLHRERYACARCGRAVRPRRRAAHRARCARGSEAICHLCSNTFTDPNGLQQHIKRFHLSKTSKKTYTCHVCGKTYNNQGAVRTHMIKHINKRFSCDQCPSTFSSPYTLAQHRKNHNIVQQHQCETCRVSYNTRKSLLAHLRNALCHQLTVVVCPICSRSCANQRSLASHMQTVHTTRKPYSCSECGARYSSKKSLGSHLRRHRGGQPPLAVCHLCGASFKGNNKLNRHLRSVCEKNKLEEELSAFYNQE